MRRRPEETPSDMRAARWVVLLCTSSCFSGASHAAVVPGQIHPPSSSPRRQLPRRNPDRKPPSYWCTWQAQSREWMQGAAGLDAEGAEAFWMAWRNHDPPPNNPVAGYSGWDAYLNQSYLFRNKDGAPAQGEQGWAYLFSQPVRSGLYFSLDNQWADKAGHLDTVRFPAYRDKSPSPLAALVAEIKSLGWAGLSVWVPGGASVAQLKEYHSSGVGVLKVDGGDEKCQVTQNARVYAPNLWVEHGFCGPDCPLNGPLNGSGAGRWPISMAERAVATLNCSDALRSYDMVKSLSVVEVIDRQSKLYSLGAHLPRSVPDSETPRRYIGGSGEHMVTAALGGVIQPMDSNTRGLTINGAYSVYVNGPPGRNRQNREDEIGRCIMWTQTTDADGTPVAKPFGAGVQPDGKPDQVILDDSILWDSWKFSLCDDACTLHHQLVNKTVRNGAPARITRGGLPLPQVALDAASVSASSTNDSSLVPFIIATRYPKGVAVLLTALGRTTAAGYSEPAAHVNLTVPPTDNGKLPVVGVFGRFHAVTLHFESGDWQLGSTSHAIAVSARDMLAPAAAAHTLSAPDAVWLNATSLRLDGTSLTRVGTEAKSRPDDQSMPGVVLQFS